MVVESVFSKLIRKIDSYGHSINAINISSKDQICVPLFICLLTICFVSRMWHASRNSTGLSKIVYFFSTLSWWVFRTVATTVLERKMEHNNVVWMSLEGMHHLLKASTAEFKFQEPGKVICRKSEARGNSSILWWEVKLRLLLQREGERMLRVLLPSSIWHAWFPFPQKSHKLHTWIYSGCVPSPQARQCKNVKSYCAELGFSSLVSLGFKDCPGTFLENKLELR